MPTCIFPALELALIEFNQENKDRALLAGIQIEGQAQNQKIVDTFALLLTSLYQDSPGV